MSALGEVDDGQPAEAESCARLRIIPDAMIIRPTVPDARRHRLYDLSERVVSVTLSGEYSGYSAHVQKVWLRGPDQSQLYGNFRFRSSIGSSRANHETDAIAMLNIDTKTNRCHPFVSAPNILPIAGPPGQLRRPQLIGP